jgi:hypothetical protein
MPIMVIGSLRMLRRSKLPSTGPMVAMQMDGQSDDFHFEQEAGPRDGLAVTVRLMRPDGKQRLIVAFAKLDRQSIYTRFFYFRKELPQGRSIASIASNSCVWPRWW